jgi:hypothetical protein
VYVIACAAVMVASWTVATRIRADDSEEVQIALSLAKMLQSGRTVISSNQALINDPERGDKGLTGDVVLAATTENYKKATGLDPRSIPSTSRESRLLQAEMAHQGSRR